MQVRVADYIVNFLIEKDIRDIFVLTGFGAMYLNDAIVDQPKLRYFCVRNEAASPMMAEAYARIKKIPGAVCLTAGPGSTNAVPGLAEAWVDSAPVIVISGQVKKKETTNFLNIPGLRTYGTAEINIVPVVKPLTKYAVMVKNPKSIRYHLEKAYYLATSGRPGPVWIDIPQDVQSALVDPSKLNGFKAQKVIKINKTLDNQLKQLLALLKKAKKPIIFAGNGIKLSNSNREFKSLVKKLRIPVVPTRLGIDILPFSHSLNMGLGGIKGTRYSKKLTKQADLIISLGARLAVPFMGSDNGLVSPRAKIVAVDIEKSELEKNKSSTKLRINSDLAVFFKELSKHLANFNLPDWSDWLKSAQKLKSENEIENTHLQKNPLDLYYFMSRLDSASPKGSVLITDAGSNYYVGGQVFKFERNQVEVTSATFAAMGLSIPLAIGASVAKKGKVLAVTGDGSLELNIQELKTMSYYNLDIKLFVINNNGYLSMRNWQDSYFEGRRIGSDDSSGAPILNLRNVSKAFDLKYEIIDDYKNIDSKLKIIIAKPGPLFVEVICDSDQKIISPE